VARAKAEADAKANTAKAKAQPASTGDTLQEICYPKTTYIGHRMVMGFHP
jgi:hypothetical protein